MPVVVTGTSPECELRDARFYGQIAGLKPKEHKIAFIVALVLLLWLVVSVLSPRAAEPILTPIGKILAKIPFSEKVGPAWLFIVPILWFLTCYCSVKFYLLASKAFQTAIAGLAFIALIMALALHEQTARIDWTPYGLNPNRSGFKPQVVVLCGIINGMQDGGYSNHRESAYFEIRMRGSDFYYSRKWNNPEWEIGSWYQMQLAIPGCAWQFGSTKTGHGTGGGGGSWFGLWGDLIPARRLWDGSNFVGADTNKLTAEEREWHIKEEFQNLQKVGPYLVPRRIIYCVGLEGREEVYTVKKVEFWNEPSTDWFSKVRQRYVDGALTNDLHEPNW